MEHLPEHHEQPDEWHSHGSDRPQAEHASQVNATVLAIAFLATVLSVVVVVVVVTVYFNSYLASIRARKVETLTWATETAGVKAQQQQLLNEGGDGLDATFAPMSEAMSTVVREYADLRADAN